MNSIEYAPCSLRPSVLNGANFHCSKFPIARLIDMMRCMEITGLQTKLQQKTSSQRRMNHERMRWTSWDSRHDKNSTNRKCIMQSNWFKKLKNFWLIGRKPCAYYHNVRTSFVLSRLGMRWSLLVWLLKFVAHYVNMDRKPCTLLENIIKRK